MQNYTMTVATTATLIWKATQPGGDQLVLSSVGSGGDFHIGGPGVTTTTGGMHMPNNMDNYSVTLPQGTILYAAAGVAASPLYVTWLNDR